MSMRTTRYSQPAIWLHWITSILMLFMLFVGQGYMKVPGGTSLAGWAPSTHASFGILILLLTLARLLWRLGNSPPAMPQTMYRWQVWAAHAVHWIFYALMIVIPLTGLLALAPYGAERLDLDQVTFFKLFPVALRFNVGDWVGDVHGVLFRVTKILVIVHVLAALKHHFWDKDRLLSRMWLR